MLLRTGWDRHWGTDAYGEPGHPFLTLDGAAHLAQHGALLVGIDSVNIDDTADPRRPAHSTLLAHGIPIVEHLRGLDQLPPDGFRFHAAPPMVGGLATFPVRAYAIVRGTPDSAAGTAYSQPARSPLNRARHNGDMSKRITGQRRPGSSGARVTERAMTTHAHRDTPRRTGRRMSGPGGRRAVARVSTRPGLVGRLDLLLPRRWGRCGLPQPLRRDRAGPPRPRRATPYLTAAARLLYPEATLAGVIPPTTRPAFSSTSSTVEPSLRPVRARPILLAADLLDRPQRRQRRTRSPFAHRVGAAGAPRPVTAGGAARIAGTAGDRRATGPGPTRDGTVTTC